MPWVSPSVRLTPGARLVAGLAATAALLAAVVARPGPGAEVRRAAALPIAPVPAAPPGPPLPTPEEAKAAFVGPEPPWASHGAFRGPPGARLALAALHFDERIEVTPFDAEGRPDPAAFAALAHAMRCKRSGRARPIDPRLVVLLVDLQAALGVRTLQLVSGFRAADAHTKPTSLHVQGLAADVRAPGVGPLRVYRLAERLGAGGVGLYPRARDRFVHVDVRTKPARWRERWNGRSARRPIRHARAHAERLAAWPLAGAPSGDAGGD